jgi:hypothetical protein
MSKSVKQWVFVLVSPLLTATLLVGMVIEHNSHVKPEDVEPYHARAKAAVNALPWFLGERENWTGKDHKIPREAVAMLRPNAIINRAYTDVTRPQRHASLLIVQTKDIRDMLGHYPPYCYPGIGWQLEKSTPRDFRAGRETIPGTEYQFLSQSQDGEARHVIYNFMIVPGVGIVRDMQGVLSAAERYEQRYYGASQFQVLMAGELPADERDAIFEQLIGPLSGMIRVLKNEESEQP